MFFTTWSLVLLGFLMRWSNYLPISDQTLDMLIVGGSCFSLGSVVAFGVAGQAKGPAVGPSRARINLKRLARLQVVLTLALGVNLLLQFIRVLPAIRAAGGVLNLYSSGPTGAIFRSEYLARAATLSLTPFSGGSALLGLANYASFIGWAAFLLGPLLLSLRRRLLGLMPLGMTAAYSLATLERYTFLYSASYFFFSVLAWRQVVPNAGDEMKEHAATRRRRPLAAVLVVLIGAPLLFYVPLTARSSGIGVKGALAAAGTYLVALLDVSSQIVGGTGGVDQNAKGYGTWTFAGAVSILHRAGVPLDEKPQTFPFVSVSYGGPPNQNAAPYFTYLWLDFGFLGIIIGSLAFGAASTYFYLALRLRRLAALPYSVMLSTAVLFSFFGFTTVRDARYLVLAIGAPALFRRIVKPSLQP